MAQPWEGSTQCPPGQQGWTWPWPEHVLQPPQPTPTPGFRAFFPTKNYGFYIVKILLSFHLSARRAGVPTLRHSWWARLSGQDALPAADIPRFAGNLHIPGTSGQGSLGTSPPERSPWHPCMRGSKGRNKKVASPSL